PGQPLERGQRVARGAPPAGAPGADEHPAMLGRREHPPGPGGERRGCEASPVVVLPAEPEEEIAGGDLARVDHRPSGPAARALGQDLGTGLLGDPPRGQLDHRRPLSSAPATSRSSDGTFLPPSNSCLCSWPLPAL